MAAKALVDAVDDPPASMHDILDDAHSALPAPGAEHAESASVAQLVEGIGWRAPVACAGVEALILWCGFLGAWLLVAGPLFQAAREIAEQQDDLKEVYDPRQLATAPMDDSQRPSAWWWLIPPVGYWLQRKYSGDQRRAAFAAMPPDARQGVVTYMNIAAGWIYVACGAFLIAIKETWELAHHYEWSTLVFVGMVLLMAGVAAANTAARMSRSHDLAGAPEPG